VSNCLCIISGNVCINLNPIRRIPSDILPLPVFFPPIRHQHFSQWMSLIGFLQDLLSVFLAFYKGGEKYSYFEETRLTRRAGGLMGSRIA
jgi:hypothetical protein